MKESVLPYALMTILSIVMAFLAYKVEKMAEEGPKLERRVLVLEVDLEERQKLGSLRQDGLIVIEP